MNKKKKPITEIKELFLAGEMTKCLRAIEAYEARLEEHARKAGGVSSPKKSEAAKRRWEARQGRDIGLEGKCTERELIKLIRSVEEVLASNGSVGTEEVPLAEQNRSGSVGAVPVLDREVTTFSAKTGAYATKVLPKLPTGVMKGSQLEGRGHE